MNRYENILAFIESDTTYLFPAPGGALINGSPASSDAADLWMAALAASVAGKSRKDAVDILVRRADNVRLQAHFGKDFDTAIVERIESWITQLKGH